jgi:predicted extracellular nuclease
MRNVVRSAACLAVISVALVVGGGAQAIGGSVVISQAYGGGGNSGATFKNDFIELYNPGTAAVDLSTWSVQYAATAGTTWQRTNLSGTLAQGAYYLIQEAQGAGGTTDLPTPNATGTIAMSATAGKVALVGSQATIAGGTSCPTGTIDFVGYGTGTSCFEGSGPTATLSNTTAALRAGGGATDTDDNAHDFTTAAPNPRSSAGDAAPSVASTAPADGASGVDPSTNLTITFSEPLTVDAGWFSIQCTTSGAHTATLVAGSGPVTYTLDPDTAFVLGETCTTTITATAVHDVDTNDPPDTMAVSFSWGIATATPPVKIDEIQGAGQFSPKKDQSVSGVQGIVTAAKSTGSARGFFMQDPQPDADPKTSEGIFVFTGGTTPAVHVGDAVTVAGTVREFVSPSSGDLPETELVSPTTTVRSSGNPLPAPVVIGQGGLQPPTASVTDGIAFDESLEGMLVQLNDARTVSRVDEFGELWVVPDGGAGAGVLTPRGGILLQADDANPEKFRLDDGVFSGAEGTMPTADVGASGGTEVGVMDYAFDNYTIHLLHKPTWTPSAIAPETTSVADGAHRLTVATFNVENLAPQDPASKFAGLADVLVKRLGSPDIVALEEVQDSSGATDGDGVVDSTVTLDMLRDAVIAAGGPRYDYRWVNPVADQDGGQPGGNIRVVFFFRTDVPGLSFAPAPPAARPTPRPWSEPAPRRP